MQSTMGGVEETIGKVTGLESWKTSGQERRAQGDTEHKEAQTQGYTEGLKDRALGKKDQVAGAVSGDTSQEVSGMSSHSSVLDQQDAFKFLLRRRPQRARKDPARLESVVNRLHSSLSNTMPE